MKIAIGSDHGGFNLKAVVVRFLTEKGHEVLDAGAVS
jgi:ribose 5-phosphate isomerase B